MNPQTAVQTLIHLGFSVYRIAKEVEAHGPSIVNVKEGGQPGWQLGQDLIALAKAEQRKAGRKRNGGKTNGANANGV